MKTKKIVNTIAILGLLMSFNAQADSDHDHSLETSTETICIGESCPKYSSVTNLEDLVDDEDSMFTGIEQPEHIQALILGQTGKGKVILEHPETKENIEVDIEDRSIEFIDETGAIIETFNQAKYAAVMNSRFTKSHPNLAAVATINGGGGASLARWSECTGSVRGRYVLSKNCTKTQRVIHPSLLSALSKLPKIVGAKSVFLVHHGIAGDARHRKKGTSLHNTFRAVDVSSITAGKRTYSYKSAAAPGLGTNRKFYNKVHNGWIKAVRSRCGKTNKDTTIRSWDTKFGSKTRNSHRKHMHLGSARGCK